MPLTVLRDGHREILRLIEEIIDSAGHSGAAGRIARARHVTAQVVARYLAEKNRLVIAPLTRSPCPAHRELARRLNDEALAVRQSIIEHYGIWTPAAIEADPREYRMAVRAIARSLERRVQFEEDEVYPRVIEAMQALAARSAA